LERLEGGARWELPDRDPVPDRIPSFAIEPDDRAFSLCQGMTE